MTYTVAIIISVLISALITFSVAWHIEIRQSKKRIEFYLGVVRDDLDVVRENPTHHEGWVNIFKCGLCYSVWVNIYPTKEDALNDTGGDEGDVYITTIKIEWEE